MKREEEKKKKKKKKTANHSRHFRGSPKTGLESPILGDLVQEKKKKIDIKKDWGGNQKSFAYQKKE